LGRLAELNADGDTMYKAFRRAVALGQHSCFAAPEAYIGLAKALQPKIRSGSMRDKKLCSSEAFNLIEHARLHFDLTHEDALKCALAEADTLFNINKEKEGECAYRVACHIAEQNPQLAIDTRLDFLSARFRFETEEIAMKYGNLLLLEIGADKRLQTKYYKVLEGYFANQPDKRLEMMLDRGKELIDRNDLEDAIDLFSRAVQLKDADDQTRLQLFRAYVAWFAQGHADTRQLPIADDLCKTLSRIPEVDPMFITYERLKQQWQEITNRGE
jgi:hypothetical protein